MPLSFFFRQAYSRIKFIKIKIEDGGFLRTPIVAGFGLSKRSGSRSPRYERRSTLRNILYLDVTFKPYNFLIEFD